MDTVDSIRDLRRECGLPLGFPQFADDLGSRPLGTLFLRDSVVGTRQLRRRTIATRIDAIALHLATVAGIAGSFNRGRHRERR